MGKEAPVWAWHLSDGLGSVRQLTDGEGGVTLAQGYTPFGLLLWQEGDPASAYGFTGEQEDAAVGLVFLRARYYDPATGRFLSKDPHPGSIYQPQTLNPYVYVLNNPVNDRDPSGEQGEDALDDFLAVANDFLMGVVYQFVDNNLYALPILEPARSHIRNGLDQVAVQKSRSIAFLSGRLTGSLISIGQAILEISTGVPMMGCGTIGAGATSWTGVGVPVGGGVVVVGAAVTAHGVVVGVVSAANAGAIAGDIYWMVAKGSGGGGPPKIGNRSVADVAGDTPYRPIQDHVDKDYVERFAQDMANDEFDWHDMRDRFGDPAPIIIVKAKNGQFIREGHHRVLAAKLAGVEIPNDPSVIRFENFIGDWPLALEWSDVQWQ